MMHGMTHPPMTGTVIRVIDGDTIVVMVDGIEMRIRLWGIDAPESDQKEGAAAQRELENMTPLDSRVVIHPLTLDRYGRVVGNIGNDSEWSVNFMMVAHGRAYHYKEPSAMRNPCLLEGGENRQGQLAGHMARWDQRGNPPLGTPAEPG